VGDDELRSIWELHWGSFLVINIGHPTEGSYRPRLPRLDQDHTVRFA
jgi:hypothetical protein